MLVYDIEIKSAICKRGEKKIPGIVYCEGFKDYTSMGISTLCGYDYDEDRYRVFCDDNLDEVEGLFRKHDIIVGYNSLFFDNNIVACEIPVLTKEYLDNKSYDIFSEIRKATGTMIGLDAVVRANNLASGKTGNGAMAPVWYQEGEIAKVIDYCLADVWLTKKLLDKIISDKLLINPRNGSKMSINSPHPGDNK